MKKISQVDLGNANVVVRGDYIKVIEEIIAGGFCPFCEEHIFTHHRQPILQKTEHWLVTENAWPYKGTRHHFLIIARGHVEKTEDLSAAAWIDFHEVYQWLIKSYGLAGATLMIRSGETMVTGASVNHLHAHLIVGNPRAKDSKPIKALVGFEQ
jgi:diadenosine tetraphosphate (Ap4A) HIT family hydrolase